MEDYYDRIDELNALKREFSYILIRPRYPSPRCFHLWHREFRMTNTNPTSLGSKRFTEPRGYEYVSSDLLQFFSMRFAGDFSHGEKMSIYGFVAVRDKIDCLRNYIFYRSSDHAQEITPDARDLLLIPPARGISGTYRIIVEYCLKVKSNGSDAYEEDGMLMDGCFEFKQSGMAPKVQMHKVRLFGPLGPLDTRFALFRFAVEATIDVRVKRAIAGYSLSMVTACTCGFLEEIVLYSASADDRMKDGRLSSSVVAVASAVMAVELGCELKLTFEIASPSEERGCGLGRHVRKSTHHELRFTAQKHKSSKGAIAMGRMFKLAANVTWSTMGNRYSPFFSYGHTLAWPSEWPVLLLNIGQTYIASYIFLYRWRPGRFLFGPIV
ncbi:unnamed protein product [Urochloa decumbens]|uniref:DUF6598 domain-containing protein n=1 Tax=Urochloa decumbens TaxID=240449 RepID=A0ABC9H202_9POAL